MSSNLLSILGSVTDRLMGIPEGREIFRRTQAGELTPEQAAREFVMLIERKGLMQEMREASQTATSLVRSSPESSAANLIKETSTGVKQLNPLYEGAIAERAFLDGDVPELRSGPLPEGATPAVPVVTETTNPVAVGMMLERASRQVDQNIKHAIETYSENCRGLLSEASEDPTALARVLQTLPAPPTGVQGYEAGSLPVPLTVQPPTPLEVATAPLDVQQKYAFVAISTTQGRRSIATPLRGRFRKHLESLGLRVSEGEVSAPILEEVWKMQVLSAAEISPEFDFSEAAFRYLSQMVPSGLSGDITLEVLPYNGISDRVFGWVLKLGTKE
jgi:hypothetical protein